MKNPFLKSSIWLISVLLITPFIGLSQNNVGIGITNPNSPLHIYKNNSEHVYLTFGNQVTGANSGDGVLVGLDPFENFRIHSYEENDILFYINNSKKMSLLSNGNLGIATGTPLQRLHVTGGTILNGDLIMGTTSQNGTGNLAFYDDSKGAFRTGRVSNDNWKVDSLGSYSFAANYNTKAKGTGATALGYFTRAIGNYSTSTGYQTQATGSYSLSGGYYSKATGNSSTALGYQTEATGSYSLAAGYYSDATGRYSVAIGRSVTAPSGYEIALGLNNETYTPNSTTGWDPDDRLFTIGNGSLVPFFQRNALTVMKGGNVGIGISEPEAKLHVRNVATDVALKLTSGDDDNTALQLFEYNDYGFELDYNGTDNNLYLWSKKFAGNEAIRMTWEYSGNVGINTDNPSAGLHIHDEDLLITDAADNDAIYLDQSNASGAGEIRIYDADGDATITMKGAESGATGAEIILDDANGATTIWLDADYNGVGRVTTDELEIKGGSDLSEYFDIELGKCDMEPGMVVSISHEGTGKLQISSRKYDPAVAGIISGANGVNTGLMMGQESSIAHGSTPVVLAGRAYVLAEGPVKPGDLLTTSSTPGYAMRVKSFRKARGAIIGKALTNLDAEKGYVLVLVNLQ